MKYWYNDTKGRYEKLIIEERDKEVKEEVMHRHEICPNFDEDKLYCSVEQYYKEIKGNINTRLQAVIKHFVEEVLRSENIVEEETKLLYNGYDEAYCAFYECMACGCCDIMEGFTYCPACGKKIAGELPEEEQQRIKEERKQSAEEASREKWKKLWEKQRKENEEVRYNKAAERERFAMQTPDAE